LTLATATVVDGETVRAVVLQEGYTPVIFPRGGKLWMRLVAPFVLGKMTKNSLRGMVRGVPQVVK